MDDESKTIFEPTPWQSDGDKYTYGLHGCNKCRKAQQPGQPPFNVCGGCKTTRYCTPECQKADWRDHKLSCKARRQLFDGLRSMGTVDLDRMESTFIVALRDSKEREVLVEEFARAHAFTLQSALQAILAFAPPFDFRKKHVLVELRERGSGAARHDGNPATRYEVVGMTFCDNPTREARDEVMREAFFQVIYPRYDGWVDSCKGNPNIWGVLIVMYRVGTMSPRPMPLSVARPFPPAMLFDRNRYLSTVKEFTGKGIVFRLIQGQRKQGVLEKNGENWVWKEKTTRELKDNYGVDVTGAFTRIDPI